ncbi:MAG TPA: hypothetical protein VEN81_05705 [Planctomycetota bacterium]|nr:hypothetical protein [Planctomycetota bacterium]
MKTIFILCGLCLAGGLAWLLFGRARADHHGNDFRGLPAVPIVQLVDRPADHLKHEVRIEGTLSRQCPATGCWFFLKDASGKELKVEMAETTPKLPARVGKVATVEGQLIRFGEGYEFVGTAVEFH